MALTDTDLVNAANAAGFGSIQELTDAFTVAKAFSDALEAAAAASTPPTTVAALAQSFANRASLSTQMQQLQATLDALSTTQQSQNQAIEAQRQTLQGRINAINAALATA